MNTSKWIVAFAGVALVAGVAIAGATRETESSSCHQAAAQTAMEHCPMHAAKAEAKPIGCCEKPATEPAGCPMHPQAKPATASCHGGDSAAAQDAPAHAGHH